MTQKKDGIALSDYKKFKKDTKKIKKIIEKWFGPRCDEYLKGCVCCDTWKLFKKLTKNPFDKDE